MTVKNQFSFEANRPVDLKVGSGNGRFGWSRGFLIEFENPTNWKKQPINNIQYI